MTWVTLDSVLTGFQKLSATVFAFAVGTHLVTPEAYQIDGLAVTGTLAMIAGMMALHGRADERSMSKRRLPIEKGKE